MAYSAKYFNTTGFLLEPGNCLVNDFNRGVVAFFRTVPPGKQAVTFKDDPLAIRVFVEILLKHQTKLIAGALPWQPADRIPENFLSDCPTVL